MEKQITCPGCKTSLTYKLAVPVAIHCKYCYSVFMLQSENDPYLTVKKNYKPPVDLSVLKLSAKGTYLNKKFEIIGRIRSVNTFAISNEWLMYFYDGSYMWLSESSLSYFVVSKEPFTVLKNELKGRTAGKIVTIRQSEHFFITEISKSLSFDFEGEIPLDAYTDRAFFKYELTGKKKGDYATVIIHEREIIEAFFSKKVELNDLDLKGINEFKQSISE